VKIRLQAENPLEWIALKFNLAPVPLVDTQIAFNAARAIMAAAELGIYEAMGREARSDEDIARACGTNPRATRQLLDCLVGVGYLRWSGGRYSLKPAYRKWLLKESEANVIGKLRFQLYEWNWMARLEDYVRTGAHMELHTSATSPAEWAAYMEGMRDLSVNAARELAGKIPVPKGATELLDIGGSHGLYSIGLCKRHPGLRSTVLELPEAVASAAAIAKRYDDTGRVRHAAGNALADDLGEAKYDMVMINNVVHHFTAEQNRALAVKAARALKPGGVYAIGEFIRAERPGEGGVVASTSGLYFALTSSSGTWSMAEMRSWQAGAGLQPGKPVTAMTMPGWKMLIARKP
jgi:2-polyprenyl-3-methyl-5-hydroxy-6-metoxy-1,4-benzoquinol methylase